MMNRAMTNDEATSYYEDEANMQDKDNRFCPVLMGYCFRNDAHPCEACPAYRNFINPGNMNSTDWS